ncbi:periplakin-like [Lineus longissimus]|uniref:periplakin-like n=1 Tax=Lineus longissimus TaxID=88925 RepID=UPI00315D78B2
MVMDFRLLGPLSPKECIKWLEDYKTALQNSPLGGSLTGVQHCIRRLHVQRKEIEGFRELIERYKSLGTSRDDIDGLESRYSSLVESAHYRQKNLETVLQVVEVEDFYQNLSNEVSERALNLVASEIVPTYPSKSFVQEDHLDAHKLNETWQWLDKVSECQEVHTKNAATYHQFYHRAHIVERRIAGVAVKLKKYQTEIQYFDPHSLIHTVRDASKTLLQLQEQVEWLSKTCLDVQPLKQRRRPDCPQKVRALVTYAHDDISVIKGHVYEIVEAVDQSKWMKGQCSCLQRSPN